MRTDGSGGSTAASTAFSTDAAQKFLYVGNRSQAKVMVFERKKLELLDSFGKWGSEPGDFGTLHHMAAEQAGRRGARWYRPVSIYRSILLRPGPGSTGH